MLFRLPRSVRVMAAAGAAATPSFAVGPRAAAAATPPSPTPPTTVAAPPFLVEGLSLSFGRRMVVTQQQPHDDQRAEAQAK